MEEKQQKVLLLRSAPGQPEAASALELGESMQAQESVVSLALVQDAVLCALRASDLESAQRVRALVARGARCHYLAEDLAMRGYGPDDVLAGCEPVGYDGLVDLLLADGVRVAGAF